MSEPTPEANSPPQNRLRRGIRQILFCASLIAAAAALVLWLLPIDRTKVVLIRGLDGKSGFINEQGRVVIEPVWDRATWVEELQVALIQSGGLFGLVDNNDRVLLPAEWSRLSFDEYTSTCFIGVRNYTFNEEVYIGASGKVLESRPESKYKSVPDYGVKVFAQGNRFGLKSDEGEVLLEPKSLYIGPFDDQGMALVRTGSLIGWIDTGGNYAIRPEWTSVGRFDKEGMAPVCKNRKWGWIDRRGKVSIIPYWERVSNFDSEGMAAVQLDGKFGWIDRDGTIVIAPTWDEFSGHKDRNFRPSRGTVVLEKDAFGPNGLASVQLDEKWGCINREGEVVIEPKWKGLAPFDSEGMAMVYDDPGFGWIDSNGDVVIDPQWSRANDFDRSGLAYVNRSKSSMLSEMGEFINRKGERVLQLQDSTWNWEIYSLMQDTEADGYVATKPMTQVSWLRLQLMKIGNWFKSEDGVVSRFETRCLAYNSNGDIIWANHWMRYETKCMIVFGAGLLVAVFTRPFGLLRRRKPRRQE